MQKNACACLSTSEGMASVRQSTGASGLIRCSFSKGGDVVTFLYPDLRIQHPLRQLLQVFEKWRHRFMTKQILTAMKLTAILLILTLHVCAKSSSQTITFSGRDVSLNKLFNEIKRQTGYGVFGNASLLRQTHKVSIAAINMPLNNFLQIVFKDQPVAYRLLDKTIILYKRDDAMIGPEAGNRNTASPEPEVPEDPVKGRVLGADGKPLPGVSIRIKGGTTGVSTDEQGNFTIPVKAKQTLIISYIGMETQELRISDPAKPIKIILQPSDASMKDIVITGYSNLRKESFTGNSVKVEREQILKVAQRNVIDVMQVFDPSFRVELNNLRGSDPNNLPNFYIRGRSGIGVKALDASDLSRASLQNNPNLPVFIMDGYEVTTERVYDLDPTRIKSITILKDAAATAIYGSRAANGVVVIESVPPVAGKLRVNYNFVSSFTAPDLSDYNLMNAAEKLEAEKLAGFFESEDPNLKWQLANEYLAKQNQVTKGVNTDWISQPVTNEFNQKHTLSFDGGTNEFRFSVLLKYDHQNGVMKKSRRERKGAGLAVEYRLNNFQIRNDITYDIVKGTNSPYGKFSDYTWKAPYDEMVGRDGRWLQNTNLWHGGATDELMLVNPLYEVHNTQNSSTRDYEMLINNFSINWRVLPHLQLKGQLSVSKATYTDKDFIDPASGKYLITPNTDYSTIGELTLGSSERLTINTNLFANYVNSINRHNMNFSVGINTNEIKDNGNIMYYTGFPSGSQNSPNFAAKREKRPSFSDNHKRMFGSFLALNYSYNDIYLLDVSSRLDGSSEFGSEKRYAPFWSLGAGLNLHKYGFLRDNPIISRARVTGSFGQLGKTNFQPYEAKDNYVVSQGWYRTGVGGQLVYLGNPSLTWEKTNTYDLILDMGFFKDRLNLNVNWYNKVTKDLVNDVDLPLSSGFTVYKENIGTIRNRGIEMFLRADVLRSKDLLIAVYANFASNKNTLVDISRSLQKYNNKVDSQYIDYNEWSGKDITKKERFSTPHTKYVQGGSLTSIFGMRSLGINPMDGKEIYLTKDGTITYDWNAADQVIIGDATPKGQGAFGVNISYKEFTLFTSCLYQYGSQEYNYTLLNKVENVDLYNRNTDRRVLTERWQKPGDVTKLKDIRESLLATRPTSRFIQDYNAITINSISLGYNVKPEWLKRYGISMCRVQLSTNNVATISSVKQERGLEYPFARTFDLSLNVGF